MQLVELHFWSRQPK